MAQFIESRVQHCTLDEWEHNTRPIFCEKGLENYYRDANIFGCMQFAYEEIFEHRKECSYTIKVKAANEMWISVGWMTSYFISTNTARIRGLHVLPEYQNQGLMTKMLQTVIKDYEKVAAKMISFSYQSSISFHLKNGFSIEKDFMPRPYQYFDIEKKRYENTKEIFTLLSYKFISSPLLT